MSGTSSRLQDEINDIPLADEDVTEELSDIESHNQSDGKLSDLSISSQRYGLEQSIESIPSAYTNGTDSPSAQYNCNISLLILHYLLSNCLIKLLLYLFFL